jgi:hypothetical protein
MMPEPYIIYILAGVLVTVLVILFLSRRYEKARREELRQLARRLEFSYEMEFTPDQGLQKLKLFNKGHSRKATNLLSGERHGVPYQIFDYRYTVGGGRNSHTFRQTVASAFLFQANLPHFILAPENFFHKIGEKFGFQDIDFSHFPGFSEHYLLRGENVEAIRQLFNTSILEYFQGKKFKATLEGDGNSLIFYKSRKRIKPEDMEMFYHQFREIVPFFTGNHAMR